MFVINYLIFQCWRFNFSFIFFECIPSLWSELCCQLCSYALVVALAPGSCLFVAHSQWSLGNSEFSFPFRTFQITQNSTSRRIRLLQAITCCDCSFNWPKHANEKLITMRAWPYNEHENRSKRTSTEWFVALRQPLAVWYSEEASASCVCVCLCVCVS